LSRFFDWTPDDQPGYVHGIRDASDLDRVHDVYSPDRPNRPLRRILDVAAAHGVQSIVVEQRYIDFDYRSEHSRFYSTTFRRYPSVCHRLHFFKHEARLTSPA
jgi:hypothetical protein